MGKYLLLIALAVLVYWIVRSAWRRRAKGGHPNKAAAETMVRCAQCGIHLPRAESLIVRGQYYCCTEHQPRNDPGH
jgi:uncharacterized protein